MISYFVTIDVVLRRAREKYQNKFAICISMMYVFSTAFYVFMQLISIQINTVHGTIDSQSFYSREEINWKLSDPNVKNTIAYLLSGFNIVFFWQISAKFSIYVLNFSILYLMNLKKLKIKKMVFFFIRKFTHI